MTGPVTRWLRRPVFWKAGLTRADVLILAATAAAALLTVGLWLISTASRGAP